MERRLTYAPVLRPLCPLGLMVLLLASAWLDWLSYALLLMVRLLRWQQLHLLSLGLIRHPGLK